MNNNRYLKCETLTGDWWYKDMETGEDLPLFTTPFPERETTTTYETGNIDELEEIVFHCPSELQQEIERLKEENVILKSQLLQDDKSYYDMQDRIRKAIEYIKNNSYFEGNQVKTMIYQDYSKYILEILQGKSDE